MRPDDVFALLVDANPVPDVDPTGNRNEGSGDMSTVITELDTEPPPGAGGGSRRPQRWLVTAAVVLGALLVAAAAIALVEDDDQSVTTAANPSALPTEEDERVAAAIEAARSFAEAVNDGDIESVVALSHPSGRPEADRRMWEMNALWAGTTTIGECRAVNVFDPFVEIECDVVSGDPVFHAVGVAELRAPYRIHDDGTVAWMPWRGADFTAANRAYAKYLRTFHPDGYDAVCDPVSFAPMELSELNHAGGLVLTRECGELFWPLADEVARWVEDGRPQP